MRKFDLSLRSSRSSYFATFRHQLTILSKTDALNEEFFFSSRRRHTRYIGDWSSDVCSSDLERAVAIFDLLEENSFTPSAGYQGPFHVHLAIEEGRLILDVRSTADEPLERIALPRSEERRVGKECRYRWSPAHE